jgi:hypothetical protein
MNKKFFIIIIFLISLSFSSLQDVENEINQDAPKSSSTSTIKTTTKESTVEKDTGYKHDVKVVNSYYEFNYRPFTSNDFSTWYDFFIQAMSYELFFYYLQEGYITGRGEVLKPLENNIYPGSKISIDDMHKLAKEQFSLIGFYNLLKRNNVLNSKGYINKTEMFTGNFETYDFSFLLSAIKDLDLPINDERLVNELKNELYNYFIASSKLLVINKLETTRYESNKDGILENLLDNVVGNFVGGIFYPDRVKKQTSTVSWSPGLDLDKYFGVYYLFNDFPFADGYKFTRIFGRNNMKDFSYSLLYDVDKKVFNDTLTFKSSNAIPSPGKDIAFFGYGISIYNVRDKIGDSFQFYNLFGSFGMYFTGANFNFDFGLSYKRGNPEGLGFYWGYGLEFLLFQPLSVFVDHNGAFQPKYSSEYDQFVNNWSYQQFRTGLKAYIGPFSVGGGYQWSTGLQGPIVFGSFVF